MGANYQPCVFCEIVADVAPAEVVRRWGDAIAFVPLNPVTPGHVLVVPHRHVAHALVDPFTTAMTMRRATQSPSEVAEAVRGHEYSPDPAADSAKAVGTLIWLETLGLVKHVTGGSKFGSRRGWRITDEGRRALEEMS